MHEQKPMKKYILSLSIFALTAAVVPTTAMAAIDIVELSSAEPTIEFSGKTLHIENAQGEVLRIYDVTGIAVMTIKVTSPSQRIDLSNLPKSCYIVKVGKLVRKISVK